jgi:putative ubiquitin-RnfH superfamily antitoxin RatB of RatAB toxin-antitoxin module
MKKSNKSNKSNSLHIEVCYGTSQKQHIEPVDLTEGSTLKDAVMQAEENLRKHFPEMLLDFETPNNFGIFSQVKPPETVLKDGDRIEIYRPLSIDPMLQKQQRQAQKPIRKIPR